MKSSSFRKREKGSALLAALGLIFTASALTAAVLILSKNAAFDIHAHTSLQKSRYVNEGAATRVQWLIAADSYVYNERNLQLGSTDYDSLDHDRYLADGIEHTIDYHGEKITFSVTDANSGLPLASNSTNLLTSMAASVEEDDYERNEKLLNLIPLIRDYTDTDGDLSTDGMEESDYEDREMAPLPRNSAILYREELFYIPGFAALFPPDKYGRLSRVRLPALAAIQGRRATNPNFFTATAEDIKLYCNLEDDVVSEVLKAREAWFRDRTPIADQLDEQTLANLQRRLSWTSSGYHTVTIRTGETPRKPSHTLIFSFKGFPVSGPEDNLVKYYEFLML